MLYKYKLGHNATEATKNIYVKGENTVGDSTVTRWFKKLHIGCKNPVDFKVVLQAIEEIWWVAFWEYQASLASYSLVWFVTFYDLCKIILSCQTVPHVTKTLQKL